MVNVFSGERNVHIIWHLFDDSHYCDVTNECHNITMMMNSPERSLSFVEVETGIMYDGFELLKVMQKQSTKPYYMSKCMIIKYTWVNDNI